MVMVGSVWAAEGGGSAAEAQALLARAVALIESDGAEAAYARFTDPAGGFVDRDLYVFVVGFDGKTLAHGGSKALVGKEVHTLKDANGKAFIQEMIEVARDKGEGAVDYRWTNKTTKKIEDKRTFVRRAGNTMVGVGIYIGQP